MRRMFFLAIASAISFGLSYYIVPPRPHFELKVPEEHFELMLSGSQLITCPRVYEPDKALRIWNLGADSEVVALALPQVPQTDSIHVKYAPDGQTFVAGGWHASNLYSCNGNLLHRFECYSTHYSPDSQYLFVEGTKEDEHPSSHQEHVSLWSIRQGCFEWSIHAGPLLGFDFDGSRFVSREQNKLCLWESSPPAPPRRLQEHEVKFSLDFDSHLHSFVEVDQALFSEGPTHVSLRDMDSGRVCNTYALAKFGGHFDRPLHQEVHFCDEERIVILEQSSFSPILVLPGSTRVTLCEKSKTFVLLDNKPAKVVLSESKRWLAIRSSGRLLTWDMMNMREHLSRPIDGNEWPARFAFNSNGDYFFTADELDTASHSFRNSLDKVSFGLISRFWPDDFRIQVWDVLRKSPVLSIPLAEDAVFSSDGRWIATKHAGGIVRVWNIAHHANWPIVWIIAAAIWIVILSFAFCLHIARGKRARDIAFG